MAWRVLLRSTDNMIPEKWVSGQFQARSIIFYTASQQSQAFFKYESSFVGLQSTNQR